MGDGLERLHYIVELPVGSRAFLHFRGHGPSGSPEDETAWGYDAATFPRTVDVHVAGLRQKLEADPARPRLLLTEPGVGSRLKAE